MTDTDIYITDKHIALNGLKNIRVKHFNGELWCQPVTDIPTNEWYLHFGQLDEDVQTVPTPVIPDARAIAFEQGLLKDVDDKTQIVYHINGDETDLSPTNLAVKKGRGRPKQFTAEEAKVRRLENQRQTRAKKKAELDEWNTQVSAKQKHLIQLFNTNIYNTDVLDKILDLITKKN